MEILARLKYWIGKNSRQRYEIGLCECDNPLDYVENHPSIHWISCKDKGKWYADPFILDVDSAEISLLVEEVIMGEDKGRILLLKVNKNNFSISSQKVILDIETHLSFPAILRKGDDIFVYPENHEGEGLTIYKYDMARQSLERCENICGLPLNDAIITDLVTGENQIYATLSPNPNGNKLTILEPDGSGCYKVVRELEFQRKIARMAGDFFITSQGVYRPAQNCEKTYGGSIVIQKLTSLNPVSFENVSELFSPHRYYRTGMHTINSFKGWTVIDVQGFVHPFKGRIASLILKTNHILGLLRKGIHDFLRFKK